MGKYVEPKGYITPSMQKILNAGKKAETGMKPSATKGSTKPATKKTK